MLASSLKRRVELIRMQVGSILVTCLFAGGVSCQERFGIFNAVADRLTLAKL